MPRRYTSFKMSQVAYLRKHYDDKTPTELANYFGITVRQLYEFAHRHGIKRRAPNGQPTWRETEKKQNTTNSGTAGG